MVLTQNSVTETALVVGNWAVLPTNKAGTTKSTSYHADVEAAGATYACAREVDRRANKMSINKTKAMVIASLKTMDR